jgi:hypothetical protein
MLGALQLRALIVILIGATLLEKHSTIMQDFIIIVPTFLHCYHGNGYQLQTIFSISVSQYFTVTMLTMLKCRHCISDIAPHYGCSGEESCSSDDYLLSTQLVNMAHIAMPSTS